MRAVDRRGLGSRGEEPEGDDADPVETPVGVRAGVGRDSVQQLVAHPLGKPVELLGVAVGDGVGQLTSTATAGRRHGRQPDKAPNGPNIVWDVSTGDPIVPAPQRVRVPRALGDDNEILGYTPETAIAEKGVTIIERGITSTGWRDYVDIVQLNRSHPIDPTRLRAAAEAVANHRGVTLQPMGSPGMASNSDRHGSWPR